MMRRALLLRHSINILIITEENKWLASRRNPNPATKPFVCRQENLLSNEDWEFIQLLTDILAKFEETLRQLEGDGMARRRKKGWTGSYGNI